MIIIDDDDGDYDDDDDGKGKANQGSPCYHIAIAFNGEAFGPLL